jgi:hypothetical protein
MSVARRFTVLARIAIFVVFRDRLDLALLTRGEELEIFGDGRYVVRMDLLDSLRERRLR